MRPSGISEKILSTAFHFLCDWEDGLLTLDDCLDRLRRENGPERAAVASLLFEYFRHKGFIDDDLTSLTSTEIELFVSDFISFILRFNISLLATSPYAYPIAPPT